jgi:hypothetical protein
MRIEKQVRFDDLERIGPYIGFTPPRETGIDWILHIDTNRRSMRREEAVQYD